VAAALKDLGVPFWRKDPMATADKAASNHGISAMKFQLIREFLVLGYSVLLSDVDILTLQASTGPDQLAAAAAAAVANAANAVYTSTRGAAETLVLLLLRQRRWLLLAKACALCPILQDPFKFIHRDSDVEGMSDGFDPQTAYGWDDVFDDPKMGWSRWAHSFHIFTLNSGLFYIKPSERTIDLMDRITDRLNKEMAWDQAVFNEIVWKPSFDDYK
ncbi:hypothetical protein QJQ45_020876, partial [Haematococcus lacustris]